MRPTDDSIIARMTAGRGSQAALQTGFLRKLRAALAAWIAEIDAELARRR